MNRDEAKPVHWMPADIDVDEWPDNPVSDPAQAARMLLEIPPHDSDASWEAWDELQRGGYVWITVRGWQPTTELIEDEAEQFDGYEPGQEWFKRTNLSRSVLVSLSFDVREPVAATEATEAAGEVP